MRFEDEEHEPVAVVRVMADFALALTLIVLMLVGTRSPSAPPADERTASRAATPQPGAKKADLTVALVEEGRFVTLPSAAAAAKPMDGTTLAQQWLSSHDAAPATVVVQFPAKALAADMHRGLLNLQSAFGTNVVTIQTIPASLP
jgi:hypothetical protein